MVLTLAQCAWILFGLVDLTIVESGTCQWSWSFFGPISIGHCGGYQSINIKNSIFDTCDWSDKYGNPQSVSYGFSSTCNGSPDTVGSTIGECNVPKIGCSLIQITTKELCNFGPHLTCCETNKFQLF